jgi:hypothetical protein
VLGSGCTIGAHTAAAAVKMATFWIVCLEALGYDMATVHVLSVENMSCDYRDEVIEGTNDLELTPYD